MANELYLDQQVFKYDYHSGTSVGIFIGGNQVTDAVGIEGSLQQTKTPVYGYASSLYDGVANGIVQVSGVLWLNFTQAQLLSAYISNAQGHVDPRDINKGLDVTAFLDASAERKLPIDFKDIL